MRNSTPLGLVVFLALHLTAGALAAKPMGPQDILERSELSRLPDGAYAVDFTVTVRDDRLAAPVRTAGYTMLVQDRDRAIVLMLAPVASYGASMLISAGDYWLLLPRADRPLQLSRDQVIRGDVASGDLARSHLAAEYRATVDGQEEVDGAPCVRLELAAVRSNARYRRIVSWVTVAGHQTRKLELYGWSGSLLRTARYLGFRDCVLGTVPERIEITSGVDPHEITTLSFSRFRALDPSPVAFTPEGLVAFRNSATRLGEPERSPPPIEAIVARLSRRVP